MKRITAIIKPFKLDEVREALAEVGVTGLTVTECKGFGVQRGFTRGEEVKTGQYVFHPKMKVEMVVLEADVDGTVERLRASLKSGQVGEGKIFVSPVDDAIRTRTGDRGQDAIK